MTLRVDWTTDQGRAVRFVIDWGEGDPPEEIEANQPCLTMTGDGEGTQEITHTWTEAATYDVIITVATDDCSGEADQAETQGQVSVS